MIRTGEQYRDSHRDGREIHINGQRVADVTTHPMFKLLVGIQARIYDLQHDPETAPVMTYQAEGEANAVGNELLTSQQDWWDNSRATDTLLEEIGGVVTRVGDRKQPSEAAE